MIITLIKNKSIGQYNLGWKERVLGVKALPIEENLLM